MTVNSRNNQEGATIVYILKFLAIVVTGLRLSLIIRRPGVKNDVRRTSPLGLTEVFRPAFSREPTSAGR